jgi:glycosyltransferase involved in cell wall biosynthesis
MTRTLGASRRLGVLVLGDFPSTWAGNRSVSEDLAERLTDVGWTVLRSSLLPNRFARLFDRMRVVFQERRRYDVACVDLFSGPAFVWAEAACWALRRARRPYVLTLHGGNLPQFAGRFPRRVRRVLGFAAAVTAPSRYLQDKLSFLRPDILLLPNPLDLPIYRFRARQSPEPKLVWLRSFAPIYNAPLAVEVMARLIPHLPGMELYMFGPNPTDGTLRQCKQLAARLSGTHRVAFGGAVTHSAVPAALDSGDVFLNTSNVDNTPVSVMEAMASGLCIVSTDVGGVPYLLEAGVDGLLVPRADPEAMTAAVLRILQDGRLAGGLSRKARVKAEAWDRSVVLRHWEQLLNGEVR